MQTYKDEQNKYYDFDTPLKPINNPDANKQMLTAIENLIK